MKKANNPFRLTEIPIDEPFCDREKELKELFGYAKSGTSVVLYSPRRYGKTSLVKRVQSKLSKERVLTVYCDFFAVTSIEDIVGRVTKAIYAVTQKNESIFKKAVTFFTAFKPVLSANDRGEISVSVQPAFKYAGIDILENTISAIDKLSKGTKSTIHIVFDEFQEIMEVEGAQAIEASLRTSIQKSNCSYFFVGSRRRILLDIFNNKDRPFFQSSLIYQLPALPIVDAKNYIMDLFSSAGKKIMDKLTKEIVLQLKQHPGYIQKFCFFLFEISETKVTKLDIINAFEALLDNENIYYESILQGLNTKQILLLNAVAKEPNGKIYSKEFMVKHNIASTGGTQKNVTILLNKDLIESDKRSKKWYLVDPVFSIWLKKRIL